jgi:O-acetylhomoserine/O-acetylserine sulfhydrylase-like pyridoxal-dependent enzyme
MNSFLLNNGGKMAVLFGISGAVEAGEKVGQAQKLSSGLFDMEDIRTLIWQEQHQKKFEM